MMRIGLPFVFAVSLFSLALASTGCRGTGPSSDAVKATTPLAARAEGPSTHRQLREELTPFDPAEVWASAEPKRAPAAPPAERSIAAVSGGESSTTAVRTAGADLASAAAPVVEPAKTREAGNLAPPPPFRAPAANLAKELVKTTPGSIGARCDEKTLKRVGEQLAAAAPNKQLQFIFETIRNQRPQVHRTRANHIVVSTGLLAATRSEEELAIVLALQMADALVVERRRNNPILPVSTSLPGGSMDAARNAAFAEKVARQAPVGDVDAAARDLLQSAGYGRCDIAAARSRVASWDAAAPPSARFFKGIMAN